MQLDMFTLINSAFQRGFIVGMVVMLIVCGIVSCMLLLSGVISV